jgi:hypothetical protein
MMPALALLYIVLILLALWVIGTLVFVADSVIT